jgi:hypothetical protein
MRLGSLFLLLATVGAWSLDARLIRARRDGHAKEG